MPSHTTHHPNTKGKRKNAILRERERERERERLSLLDWISNHKNIRNLIYSI